MIMVLISGATRVVNACEVCRPSVYAGVFNATFLPRAAALLSPLMAVASLVFAWALVSAALGAFRHRASRAPLGFVARDFREDTPRSIKRSLS